MRFGVPSLCGCCIPVAALRGSRSPVKFTEIESQSQISAICSASQKALSPSSGTRRLSQPKPLSIKRHRIISRAGYSRLAPELGVFGRPSSNAIWFGRDPRGLYLDCVYTISSQRPNKNEIDILSTDVGLTDVCVHGNAMPPSRGGRIDPVSRKLRRGTKGSTADAKANLSGISMRALSKRASI